MVLLAVVLLTFLVSTNTSEASMSDRVIQGTIMDQRISGCGIMVRVGAVASLRPFIETSSSLSGTVRLSVGKRSASGTSQTNQNWRFSGGTLGASQVSVDLPANLSLKLEIFDHSGTGLCQLEQDLVLDNNASPV